jgi:AcrR family transcriptional regulator
MARRAWSGVGQGREELFERKRQVVLRTAARIFSQRGFHQTTLADVAEELNVSKPALYHYFKSKDEILLEIQQAAIAQMTREAAEMGGETVREQLTAFVRAYVDMITDDFGTCLITTGVLPLEPKNRKAIRAGSKAIEAIVREILVRGMADGSIAPCDPKITAMLFFGALNWIPYWYRADGELDTEQVAARIMDFVMKGLSPR